MVANAALRVEAVPAVDDFTVRLIERVVGRVLPNPGNNLHPEDFARGVHRADVGVALGIPDDDMPILLQLGVFDADGDQRVRPEALIAWLKTYGRAWHEARLARVLGELEADMEEHRKSTAAGLEVAHG